MTAVWRQRLKPVSVVMFVPFNASVQIVLLCQISNY